MSIAAEDWAHVGQVADLILTNPFHPDWMQKQRALMPDGCDRGEVYAWQPGLGLWSGATVYPDVVEMGRRATEVAGRIRDGLRAGASAGPQQLAVYELVVLYLLYRDHGLGLDRYLRAELHARAPTERGPSFLADPASDPETHPAPELKTLWNDFRRDHAAWLRFPDRRLPLDFTSEHVFALFFQLRRAYLHIFSSIVGGSRAVARLRGAVWQSIFTHDLTAWCRTLYRRMQDFPTLITGPSGTGKELVAQAIGRSLYIPYESARGRFAVHFLDTFHSVNLAALPEQLIESELFGHVKGAFTGAVSDRDGRLKDCPQEGAVFLDELGELTPAIQVKLLRLLQTRAYHRVGENRVLAFAGKVVAATNRDLLAEVQAGRFREDFYYRVCADRIETPSLREQLRDKPDDLPVMVEYIAQRVVGAEAAAECAGRVVDWIEEHLGRDYPWPGNFRELEQCVRSYTIRREYTPLHRSETRPGLEECGRACQTLADLVLSEQTTYREIERRLFELIKDRKGTDVAAARVVDCDPRTFRARLRRPSDSRR